MIFVRLTLQRGLQPLMDIWPRSRMQLSPHAKSCSSKSARTILLTKVSSMLIGPSPTGSAPLPSEGRCDFVLDYAADPTGGPVPLPQTELYTLTARTFAGRTKQYGGKLLSTSFLS